MSDWTQALRPASFRGVRFGVLDAGHAQGRRLVEHVFPQKDLPYIEALGLTGNRYAFSAFVVGADAIERRDKLLAACRADGPGELIHPTFGRLMVWAERWDNNESWDKARFFSFALAFVLEPEEGGATVTTDTRAAVAEKADVAKAQAQADFASSYQVKGQPDFVADDALAGLGDVGSLAAGLSAELLPQAGELLGLSPGDLADGLQVGALVYGLISGLSGAGADSSGGLRALGSAASYQPAIPGRLTTPSRRQVATNRAATGSLVRRAAVIERARLATTVTPASQREATKLRDDLAGQLDAEATSAADSGDYDSYRSLMDLRVEVVNDLSERGALLSPVAERKFGRPLPSLVVAQRLYRDANRADEVAMRNRAIHPGFLPMNLETLVD